MPDGAQHRRREGRWLVAVEAEEERIDGIGHLAILQKRRAATTGSRPDFNARRCSELGLLIEKPRELLAFADPPS